MTATEIAGAPRKFASPVDTNGAQRAAFRSSRDHRRIQALPSSRDSEPNDEIPYKPAEAARVPTPGTEIAKYATKFARGDTGDTPATSASKTRTSNGTRNEAKHDRPTTANDLAPPVAIMTDNGEDETSMAESAQVKQQERLESDYSDSSSVTELANKSDEPVGQEACATESTKGQGDRGDAAATSEPVVFPPDRPKQVPKTTVNKITKEDDNEFVRWPQQTNTVAAVGYTQAESARVQSMKPWRNHGEYEAWRYVHACGWDHGEY